MGRSPLNLAVVEGGWSWADGLWVWRARQREEFYDGYTHNTNTQPPPSPAQP
jgi:hypothetical protein